MINKYLLSKYIYIPTGEDLRRVVSKFDSKWGFPKCFRAIDGSLIQIFHADYHNSKLVFSHSARFC